MRQHSQISFFYSTPFGSAMVNRGYSSGVKYKYGFNTKEKDDEVAGDGNIYTAKFWQYDSRLGRRFNMDPLSDESRSFYLCLGNNPIAFNDILGLTETPTLTGKKEDSVTARQNNDNAIHITLTTITQETAVYKDGRKIVSTTAIVTENIAFNEPKTTEGKVGGESNSAYSIPKISDIVFRTTNHVRYDKIGAKIGGWETIDQMTRKTSGEDFTLLDDWTNTISEDRNGRPKSDANTYLQNHYKSGTTALTIAAIGGALPFIIVGETHMKTIETIIASSLGIGEKSKAVLSLMGSKTSITSLTSDGLALFVLLGTSGCDKTMLTMGGAANGNVFKCPHDPKHDFTNPNTIDELRKRNEFYKKLLIDPTKQ